MLHAAFAMAGWFASSGGLTCGVWLLVLVTKLGSAGVANAEMPSIGCDGGDDDKPGMTGLGGGGCETIAAALNKLDGVSGVECGGYYPYLYGGNCIYWAGRNPPFATKNLLENTDGVYPDPIIVPSGRQPATFCFC